MLHSGRFAVGDQPIMLSGASACWMSAIMGHATHNKLRHSCTLPQDTQAIHWQQHRRTTGQHVKDDLSITTKPLRHSSSKLTKMTALKGLKVLPEKAPNQPKATAKSTIPRGSDQRSIRQQPCCNAAESPLQVQATCTCAYISNLGSCMVIGHKLLAKYKTGTSDTVASLLCADNQPEIVLWHICLK